LAELPSAADEKYVQAKITFFRVFDVTIHDKINNWSVGGNFGEEELWTHLEPVKHNS
jgi:hypothetical protein